MSKRVFFSAVIFLVAVTLGATGAYAASYSAEFFLSQHQASTCPAGGGQLVFATIKNTGTLEDSYYLTATREWVVMPEVTLAPGEETSVGILIAIGDASITPGTYNVELTLHSARSKNTYRETVIVKTLDCPGIQVQPVAETVSGCSGEIASTAISVKNLGNTQETVTLSSTAGTLSNTTVTLLSGETKTISLEFVPSNATETVTITAVSKTSYAQSSAKITLGGRECYSAKLSLEPQYVRACREESAAFGIKISNTGERNDTYLITSNAGNLSTASVLVAPGITNTVVLNVAPQNVGAQAITVEVESAHVKQSATAELDAEKCYGFDFSIVPVSASSENYSGLIYAVVLSNTGIRKDTYSVALGGTPWMEIAPENLTIDSNSTKSAYVYVSPVFGIENGTYTGNVIVSSGKSGSSTKQLEFVFGTPVNETTVPPVTGGASQEVSKRTIYALIIGLAVVLVVLFGREFKKMSKAAKEGEKAVGGEEKKEGEKEEGKEEKDTKEPEKKSKKAGKKGAKGKKEKEVKDDIKDILEGI